MAVKIAIPEVNKNSRTLQFDSCQFTIARAVLPLGIQLRGRLWEHTAY